MIFTASTPIIADLDIPAFTMPLALATMALNPLQTDGPPMLCWPMR